MIEELKLSMFEHEKKFKVEFNPGKKKRKCYSMDRNSGDKSKNFPVVPLTEIHKHPLRKSKKEYMRVRSV
jgi:hypothetical protein